MEEQLEIKLGSRTEHIPRFRWQIERAMAFVSLAGRRRLALLGKEIGEYNNTVLGGFFFSSISLSFQGFIFGTVCIPCKSLENFPKLRGFFSIYFPEFLGF
jgi:hypothetical protein